jgi:hypothetical protein
MAQNIEAGAEATKPPYGTVDMFGADSAVIFRTDKSLEIISGTQPTDPVTEQLFMCLLVKEFLERKDLMDEMAKKLLDSGELQKVALEGNAPPEESTPEEE